MCSPSCSTGRAMRSVLWRAGPGSGVRPPPTTTETTSGASAGTVSGHATAPAGGLASCSDLPGPSTLTAALLLHMVFSRQGYFPQRKVVLNFSMGPGDRCGVVSSPPPQLQGLTSTRVRIAAVPGLQGGEGSSGLQGLVCGPSALQQAVPGRGGGGSQCSCCRMENGHTRVLVTRRVQTDVGSQGK